jgi:anti-sigma regulatory factor (Ser/Thr protein kinase)
VSVSGGWPSLVLEGCDHIVNFYDDEADLVSDVGGFLADDLHGDEVVVVLASQAHRHAIDTMLEQRLTDGRGGVESDRYVSLDAGEVLSRFMVDGAPDRDRFMTVVGDVIAGAAEGDRPVRAYGEMVALLWQEGNVSGAIELEALWNELGRHHQFALYCAYPLSDVSDSDDLTAARRVCEEHSRVVAPSSYASVGPSRVSSGAMVERSQLFVPVPLAARAVRRFVSQTLDAWALGELDSDAMIVVSELASNALLHASCPFRVSIRRFESTVRIEVEDLSPEPPRRCDVAADALGGRGVALVAALSTRWGTEKAPDGKVVWAELARSQ